MAFMDIGNARLHYQLEGNEEAPVLVLSNSLGTDLGMWAPQMPALIERFRVLRYDARGHGKSDVTPGPYSIPQLAGDALALMDRLGIQRAHFCGLSMGGMAGMWLGANHPGRIDRLALCNTAARIGPPEVWNARIEKVNAEGMPAIGSAVIDRWFTADFQKYAQRQVEIVRSMLINTPAEGYVASCAAVRDMDQRDKLGGIIAPTLVIAGTHDKATPPEDGKLVSLRIPGAKYVELNAAHLSNWEVAQSFTAQVVNFLTA
jgi:3-oxoadipate enol-lactonase